MLIETELVLDVSKDLLSISVAFAWRKTHTVSTTILNKLNAFPALKAIDLMRKEDASMLMSIAGNSTHQEFA
jgi:hypothetical protein